MGSLWSVDWSYTEEVVLCLGLVDDSRAHRRYMEHCLLLYLSTPHHGRTRNRQPYLHTYLVYNTELVGSQHTHMKIRRWGLPNTSSHPQRNKLPSTCNLCRMLPFGESNRTFHAFHNLLDGKPPELSLGPC